MKNTLKTKYTRADDIKEFLCNEDKQYLKKNIINVHSLSFLEEYIDYLQPNGSNSGRIDHSTNQTDDHSMKKDTFVIDILEWFSYLLAWFDWTNSSQFEYQWIPSTLLHSLYHQDLHQLLYLWRRRRCLHDSIHQKWIFWTNHYHHGRSCCISSFPYRIRIEQCDWWRRILCHQYHPQDLFGRHSYQFVCAFRQTTVQTMDSNLYCIYFYDCTKGVECISFGISHSIQIQSEW